ncbi:hypothetical protein N7478_011810 [Penicillium angulare]|uniref:uncharacterized protein n=1 Tax=Penicillium angulare TaxID=116970 RepID=UPI00253FD95F|nr:uncharacterized protein N7478_011810 [Penicillium angulare]KAJ5261215.1 hypothetical protein N7478_011810 [Penicillium angulare]
MDENYPVAAPSLASQCIFAKCSICFLIAQAIQVVMVMAMIGLRWCWKRYHQREISPLHSPPPLQEDLNEVQDITTEFHLSRLPYSEDTVVNIISDIYRIYLQLNCISDWEVTWAPPRGHKINQSLCEDLHIDPVVISLMKRLPYFRFSRTASNVEFIYRWSRAFAYLQDYEIWGGRDPNRFEIDDDPRPDFLLPHEIALTCSTDEGCHSILDTKYPQIKKILQEQYDWPYDFREAEWKAASKVTWARISRQDSTYETDREDESNLNA